MGDVNGRRDILNTIQYTRTDAVGESAGSAGMGDRFGLGMGNELEVLAQLEVGDRFGLGMGNELEVLAQLEVLAPSHFFFLPPARRCLSSGLLSLQDGEDGSIDFSTLSCFLFLLPASGLLSFDDGEDWSACPTATLRESCIVGVLLHLKSLVC